jgi:hypothetical protein
MDWDVRMPRRPDGPAAQGRVRTGQRELGVGEAIRLSAIEGEGSGPPGRGGGRRGVPLPRKRGVLDPGSERALQGWRDRYRCPGGWDDRLRRGQGTRRRLARRRLRGRDGGQASESDPGRDHVRLGTRPLRRPASLRRRQRHVVSGGSRLAKGASRPRRVRCNGALVPCAVSWREGGAGNGIRTRDFDLGKVALYH